MFGFGPDCAWAAEHALKVMREHGLSRSLWFQTCNALHLSGRSREAFDLFMGHPEFMNKSEYDAYCLACYAAPIHEMEWASKALLQALEQGSTFWDKTFLDADLEPLWEYGVHGAISVEQALRFAHPKIIQVVAYAGTLSKEQRIDYQLLGRVPETCRPYLRLNPLLEFYGLKPGTPIGVRELYLDWQKTTRDRNVTLAQTAIKRSQAVVLEHQLPWAIEKAKDGNLLGARYHLLFAILHRADWLSDFDDALRPLGLGYVLDDLTEALEAEPRTLHLICDAATLNREERASEAMDLLDDLPPSIRENTVVLIQRGHALESLGDYRRAVHVWQVVAKRWDKDAIGYCNGARALMKLSQWNDAKHLLTRGVPAAIGKLKVFKRLREQCLAQDVTAGLCFQDFYGQPDLGEILAPDDNEPFSGPNLLGEAN